MIDHATCYGIQVHMSPTRSNSLVNNLHYKKKQKKTKHIFSFIHDYVLLPRCLVFTVLCYMELFRWQSNLFVYTVIKMRQTLMDSKKGRTPYNSKPAP